MRRAFELAHRRAQAERHAGQCGTEPVVEVAPQPAPLLLAGRHDGDARSPQLGGQAHPADGEAERPGELGEHPLVTRTEGRAVLPADDESTDDLVALVAARRSLVRRRRPDRGLAAPAVGRADVDRNRVESQLALQAGDERRQQLVAGIGADVVDDAADDPERVVAGTPNEPVDGVRECVAWPVRRRRRSTPVVATSSHVGPLPPTSRPRPATTPV